MTAMTENNLYLGKFSETDLVSIAEIENLSINPPWSLNALIDFSRYDTNNILVAKTGDVVSGYITYTTVLDEIQIANVAVHPDMRRLGIGDALLNSLYKCATENDTSLITLEVRASNTPAINLYRKHGFIEVGRRKNYYKDPTEDAILMNLTL